MNENHKMQAVIMGVNLSSLIITASLAMIALIGTLATFILEKRLVGVGYYILSVSSFLVFIVSIYLGSKGINKARQNGAENRWEISDTKNNFNWQAISAFVGIALFSLSVFFSKEKNFDFKENLQKQKLISDSLRSDIITLERTIKSLQYRYDTLSKRLFYKNDQKLISKKKKPRLR